jgi:hypothetical protein
MTTQGWMDWATQNLTPDNLRKAAQNVKPEQLQAVKDAAGREFFSAVTQAQAEEKSDPNSWSSWFARSQEASAPTAPPTSPPLTTEGSSSTLPQPQQRHNKPLQNRIIRFAIANWKLTLPVAGKLPCPLS